MLLPQTAEYALRAVVHLARHEGAGMVRVPEMADALGIPRNYLSKTLHHMARAGLLASTRGPAGGFRLAIPAHVLTLSRVIAVFHDTGEQRCLIADRPCGQDPTCPVHRRWTPVAQQLHGFFGSTTVGDLVDGQAVLAAPDALAGSPLVGAALASAALAGVPGSGGSGGSGGGAAGTGG